MKFFISQSDIYFSKKVCKLQNLYQSPLNANVFLAYYSLSLDKNFKSQGIEKLHKLETRGISKQPYQNMLLNRCVNTDDDN